MNDRQVLYSENDFWAPEGYMQREIAPRMGCTKSVSVSEILKKRLTGSVKDAKIPGRKQDIWERGQAHGKEKQAELLQDCTANKSWC